MKDAVLPKQRPLAPTRSAVPVLPATRYPGIAADRRPASLAAATSLIVVAGCVITSRRATRRKRGSRRAATLLGVAVGTIYAGTAALIKASTNLAQYGPAALFTGWQLCALLAAGRLWVEWRIYEDRKSCGSAESSCCVKVEASWFRF